VEKTIGRVTHYFDHVHAAAVKLDEPLRVGETIHVVGHSTDVTATVDRMQVDHTDVTSAKPGDDVAIHVPDKVREHDEVRKILPG